MDDSSQKQMLGHIKEGSPQWNRICRRWEALLPEDCELICRLNEIKLVDLPEDELVSRLEKLNLVEQSHSSEQTMRAAAHASKLDIPQCDFPEYQQPLEDLIHEFQDIFSASTADVRKSQTSKKRQVQINLTSTVPVNVPNYRTPLKLRHVLKKLLDDLIEGSIIEKCENNEYNSPCLLVPKKAPEGAPQYRLVIDFRRLNKVIENVVYPIPRIQDILVEFNGCDVFSNMDITHAFFMIEIHPDSRKFTSFSCELGKWQFRFLPQGLKISPAVFHNQIAVFQNQISADLRGIKRMRAYIDDLLSGTKGVPPHLKLLWRLFERLRTTGYKLSLKKCQFLMKQVDFVGSTVSGNGVSIQQSKLEAVRKLEIPQTIAQVKSLLGFTSFLQTHVPYYCDIAAPIQDFLMMPNTTTNMKLEGFWTEEHDRSFAMMKDLLLDNRVLAFPDSSKPYILYTDASKKAMSGVLMQEADDVEHTMVVRLR